MMYYQLIFLILLGFILIILIMPFGLRKIKAERRKSKLAGKKLVKDKEKLNKSNYLVNSILNSANDVIIGLDKEGRHTFINPYGLKILGYTIDEVIGVSSHSLWHNYKPNGELNPIENDPVFNVLKTGSSWSGDEYVINKAGKFIPVSLNCSPIVENNSIVGAVAIFTDETVKNELYNIKNSIIKGTLSVVGKDFLRELLINLSKILDLDYAFIGKLNIDNTKITTINVVNKVDVMDNFEYDLKNTPCDNVIKEGVCCYPKNIVKFFPDDRLLQEMNIEAYAGMTLFDSNGVALGILVALSKKPFKNPSLIESTITLFAGRAGAELERLIINQSLHRAEVMIKSSIDGFIIINNFGKISFANPAVLKIFGLSINELIGKSIVKLFSHSKSNFDFSEIRYNLKDKGQWQGDIELLSSNNYSKTLHVNIIVIQGDEPFHCNYILNIMDVTSQRQSEQKAKKLSDYDILTGLPNFKLFTILLSDSIKSMHVKNSNSQIMVLYIGLDRFKNINESLGRESGDQILIQITERLKELEHPNLSIARVAGDVFGVLLKNICNKKEGVKSIIKIKNLFSSAFKTREIEIHLSVSIGASTYPDDSIKPDRLLQLAESGMYHSKATGGNSFSLPSDLLEEQTLDRLLMENRLFKAVEKDLFQLYIQPQYSLIDNRMVGAEVLIRLFDDNGKIITPGKFIPLAEEIGLINEIGLWVLKKACEYMVSWLISGYEINRIAINVSAKQLEDNDFYLKLLDTLDSYGLPHKYMDLELTETMLVKELNKKSLLLNNIINSGVKLSIDDFGTGFSSLSYLQSLPLDKLKIDIKFIRGIPYDERNVSIVRAILALAKSLNLKVLAEGVETKEQAEFLKKEGCDEAQGYYFARPMPIMEFQKLLQK